MKNYFIVSLVKNGILGGGMTADEQAITYHTGKLTVPQEYRHLVMRYEDIRDVTAGWLFVLPTVTVTKKNGDSYKFAVFFGGNRLLETLRAHGVNAA
jgi:hypothetical protein